MFQFREVILIKIMFWNLARNSIEKYIIDIISENDLDICVFSEFDKINFEKINAGLNNHYHVFEGIGGCTKIIMIARRNYSIEIRREQHRYTIYSISDNAEQFIIAGIHLEDRKNSDSDTRKNTIRNLVQDIKEQERILKLENTIVIGDYNASPFDDELVQKDAFNAVLYKDLIFKTEKVTVNGTQYKRFYNPMLSCISEEDSTYGSYYYDSGIKTIYWYFLDQVIVRKPLVNRIKKIQIIKAINNNKLLKSIKPNSSISDHLPLIVEFERSNMT